MKIKEICKGYGGMLTGCRWEYILMVEVWWSSFYGQVLLLCTKRVGKGGCGMFLIIPDCVSLCGSGAEGRYPGVVFFPLGGSVS